MSRTQISIQQLQEISHEHISYEIQMFEATIFNLNKGHLTTLERNAFLESFLLHARCLLDFLYPPDKIRADDVIADDFFEDIAEFRAHIPESLPIASFLKSRTGKEVAHLTYGRLLVSKDQKVWAVGQVHDQLAEVLVTFFELLSDEQKTWFTTIIGR